MNSYGKKTVLISELQDIDNRYPFFPYVWAILKSSWERFGEGNCEYGWLEPMWRNDAPESLLQAYENIEIDVLGLSCYTWNWKLQCAVARLVKARHPNCLVVAGGPEPDYKDPDFFRNHPYIDLVAVKDGEITFNKVLSRLAQGGREFHDISGLYMPGANGGGPICTGPPEVPLVFEHSPYLDQSPYYERLVDHYGPGAFQVIWETNRGCPYSCSFCDWGSATMSKIRRFDMGRIQAEAEWIGRMKVRFLFQADANFGILPRDVEIADLLNAVRAKYGYPGGIYYSAAKNNPDRALMIAKKFAKSGIARTHALSLQHTKPTVLAATDRSNISPEKQVEVVKALMEDCINLDVQLILGIPGDTYPLWKGCFSDLMEWGIHEDYQVYTYQLLPNAPAADKSFIEKWEIQTIERYVTDNTSRKRMEKGRDLNRKSKSRIIVQSKTYSREDWVKMFAYTAFIKALHNAGVTQRISVYLRLTHNISYLEFYECVIEDWLLREDWSRQWYEAIVDHYRKFLSAENTTEHMEVAALPNLQYALDPSRWLYTQICLQLERFFRSLTSYFCARYPTISNLVDVIAYQKETIILPSYDRSKGKAFAVESDWVRYFELSRGRNGWEPLPEPEATRDAMVVATDRSCFGYFAHDLDWGSGEVESRWSKWVEQTVLDRNSIVQRNLQRLKLESVVGETV